MSKRPELRVASAGLCLAWVMILAIPAAGFEHVIHISLDGLHAEKLRHQMFSHPDDFLNFWRLTDEGVSTFNARTDFFKTYTLPNHTSMMTGRPVMQPADDPTLHHGYVLNGMPTDTMTLHNTGNPAVDYVASVFDILHDRGYSTALYASKSKFRIFEQSYIETLHTPPGRPDQFLDDGDHGPNKIDNFVINSNTLALTDQFVADMANNQYSYAFLHLRDPDTNGHGTGWGADDYDAALRRMDASLGKVLSLIDNNPALHDNTAIIVTSDHGGWALSHGNNTDPNVYTIPQFVWGSGLATGGELYALNRYTRQDPGLASPEYTAPMQPIRNGGTGNLALTLLDLPAIDGSSINEAQDLIVTRPATADWHGDGSNGRLGDGVSWGDANNWARGGAPDERMWPGDLVILAANAELRSVDLQGPRVVSSLDFRGSYEFSGGPLKITSGNIWVAPEQTATINGDITSPISMMLRGGGTVTLNGDGPSVFLADGSFRGEATIDDFISYGRIEPGDGVGTLVVDGVYDNRAGSSVSFEINGSEDGSYDKIVVSHRASVFGPLHLVFGEDYEAPSVRGQVDAIPLIQARAVTGRFTKVLVDGVESQASASNPTLESYHAGNGLFHVVMYEGNSVHLASYMAIPGDANGDFHVDGSDFNHWMLNQAEEVTDWTQGDFNGDRRTDEADWQIWSANQFTSARPAMGTVPEPSGARVLLVALLIIVERVTAGRRSSRMRVVISPRSRQNGLDVAKTTSQFSLPSPYPSPSERGDRM